MEYEKLFNDSIEYTRETFTGHWVRWLIFILLGLPFALMQFVVDPRKIMTGSTIHWEMIPWGSIAVLVIIGFLASLFISGYIVRIYRGTRPAPDFTGWAALFIDGIKVDIVMFAWFLPALIVLLAELALGLGMITTARFTANPGTIVLMILLIPVELILLLIAIFYMTMGAVRFARTGSMAEGWRFSAISAILRRIGWWNYLIAVILLAVAGLFFNLVVSVPAVIPYVGWIVPVVLSPLLTVFAGRYFTLVYEAGEAPPPPAPVP